MKNLTFNFNSMTLPWVSRGSSVGRLTHFTRFAAMLLMLITMSVGQVWGESHFWLVGHPVDSDWGKNNLNKIENQYPNSTDIYYVDVYLKQNEEFALHNGNDRYSPSTQSFGIKIGDAGASHGYANTSMGSWKYTGPTGWVRICMNQKGGGYVSHNNDEYFPDVWLENPVPFYIQDVLNKSRVMFYFGNKWSAAREFIYNPSNGNKFVTSYSGPDRFQINGTDYWFASACLPSARYQISHTKRDSWTGAPTTSESVQAGKAYISTGDGNQANWASTSTSSFSVTDKTVSQGTANLGLSVFGYGANSVVGRAQTVKYYHKKSDAQTWTEFNPATQGNTLSVGTYTVAALVTDGNIYVRSTNQVTLTVEPITVSASVDPTSVYTGNRDLTFTISTNAPQSAGYFCKIYGFGTDAPNTGSNLNGDWQITSENYNNYQKVANNVTFPSAGTYKTKVVITKDAVVVAESDLITVNASVCAAPTKPVISGETSYTEGDNITLTASEVPTGTTYQWYKGGTSEGDRLNNQINRILSINPCSTEDAGTYYVRTTNSCGNTFSDGSTITVGSAAPVSDAWSLWYYNNGDTKIGDFSGSGPYTLEMELTNTNASTLWFQNNEQHYIAPSGSLTQEERTLTTTVVGRFEWQTDNRNTNYTLTIRNDNGTWKVKAEKVVPKATLGWNLSGGNQTAAGTAAGEVAVGTTITAPTVEKAGYDFTGWSPAFTGRMPAENTTYVAQWRATTYEITYEGLGGASNTSNPTTYTIESEDITFEHPGERAGYRFDHWDPATIVSGSTGNKTITAHWNAITPYTGNLYLLGNCTEHQSGWNLDQAEAFTNKGGGIYVIDDIYLNHTQDQNGNGFKLITQNTTWEPKYMAAESNKDITTRGVYALAYRESAQPDRKFVPHASGHYKLVVNLSDKDNGTITATPVVPSSLAICGPLISGASGADSGWDTAENMSMETNGSIKTFTFVKNVAVGNYMFCMCKDADHTQDYYLHANNVTSMTSTGCTLEDKNGGCMTTDDAYHNFKLTVTTAGYYKITVVYDEDNNTVTVDASTFVPSDRTIYFKPSGDFAGNNWNHYAVYSWGQSNTWATLTEVEMCAHVYSAIVPGSATGMCIVSLSQSENNWDNGNKINQTVDINDLLLIDGKQITLSGTKDQSSPAKYKVNVATYSVPTYTISFDANGHGTAPDAIVDLACGDVPDAPADLVEDGYAFGGWYKDVECTDANIWHFGADAVAGNTTLYAKWTEKQWEIYNNQPDPNRFATFVKNGDTYTLTYTFTGLEGDIQFRYGGDGYTLGAESLTTERTFVANPGWLAWQDGAGKFDITIRKVGSDWNIKAVPYYVVTFGETTTSVGGENSVSASNGSTLTSGDYSIKGSNVTLTASAGKNYKFAGWYKDAAGTNAFEYSNNPFTFNEITYSINLYAKFVQRIYGMTIDNGNFDGWDTPDMAWLDGSVTFTKEFQPTQETTYTFAISSDVDRFGDKKLQNANVTIADACQSFVKNRPDHITDLQMTLPDGHFRVTFTYTPSSNTSGTLLVTKEDLCPAISWDGVQDDYYVYVGHDLSLPTAGANETYAWSGSDKITDNVYNCSYPHKSQPTVTATSTCSSVLTATKTPNIHVYKYAIKYGIYNNEGENKIYNLVEAGENKYYYQCRMGSASTLDVIAYKQTVTDGQNWSDLSNTPSHNYYSNATVEAGLSAGDLVYIIYNNAGATGNYKTANGSVEFKAVESISFSYEPEFTMTGFAQDPAQATATAAHLDNATVTKQYSIDGGANWLTWESFTPSEAGTYKFRATATGTNALGVPSTINSNVVEIAITKPSIDNIAVSAYPRQGATVTVTPTVSGLQSGEYHYCWSLLKNGEAQDVSFTRDGETNNWTFTAPEAGDYTLRLEVKPGSDCEGAAIVTESQDITILGNSIVVKMKRDPYTYWELDNYIYYYKNETKNAEWPGEKMTYLGKDEEGFPWYSFVINNFNTYNGGTLVFNENKQDKNASQTQDIAMPQTDACYFVSASLNHEWKRKATLIDECPNTEARVLLTSATTNLYQNVTYTVKAQVVFLPGDEFTYSCTITDPSSQAVTLDEHNSFIPSVAGTYHIVLRATNEFGDYAETVYDLVFAANPITLAVSEDKTVGLDNVITLTTSSTHALNNTYKYTYTVIEPGTHDEVTFQKATTNATTSSNYTMRSTGTYLFFVHITDASGNTVGRAQREATVASMKCWIKHDWDGQGTGHWYWHEMTYRQDGTYKYYNNTGNDNEKSAYRGDDGANVVMQMDQPASNAEGNYITINNPYNLTQSAEAVVYIYDAAANKLEVRPAGETTVYRIKSTCSDGVYYSNTVNNASEKLSFYAQKNGSLQWQYRQGTADDWIDGTVISTDKITKNTVYQATINTLGAADGLATCKAYTGAYYVYTAAAPNASAQMTAFTKSPLQSNEYYNHYYTVHQTDNCNLMATVGNAINHNLSVVLPYYKLPREANVRYGYDDETNLFVRACIDNSTTENFLMLYGNNLSTTANTPVEINGSDEAHMLTLTDVSDWIYTCTVRTTMDSENPVPTKACLRTVFDGKETWILAASGLESDEDAQIELLNDRTTSPSTYDLNIIYDYKTNRLVAGWTPGENTIFNEPIMVDQMLITRVGDGAATQFEIKENNARQNEILVVKQMTLEFVFNKSEWTSSWSSTNGSVFYWISVPYECRVSDIFGLGAYKGKWEIQDYRGDMLAKGIAGSTPWRILNLSSTMKPNHGYVLRFFGLEDGDFKTVGELSAIRMYFPSHQSVELTTQPVTELPVNENAKTHPSQWDWCVAGVPLMKSGGLVENVLPVENPNNTAHLESYYKWGMDVGNGERWYAPVLFSGRDAEPMLSTHGYMVQGIGSLVWTYPTNIQAPSPVHARRAAISTTNMDIRLDLMKGDAYQDRTYVLYREGASREFELGRDLPKIENAGRSMLWSAMDNNLATNCIADDDYELIPLTVVAAQDGEYTIHLNYMEGGDDMQPILYDAVEGTTTMMRYQDHTIELNAGKYENRFFVGLRKAAGVVTGLENVGAEADGVQKLLYDGKLYIVTDGHIFDATGRQIK